MAYGLFGLVEFWPRILSWFNSSIRLTDASPPHPSSSPPASIEPPSSTPLPTTTSLLIAHPPPLHLPMFAQSHGLVFSYPKPPIPTNEPVKPPQPIKPPKQTYQPHPRHKTEPLKHPKTIHIDQKTFGITQVGGRNYPFCITKRKSGKVLGKIWIGPKDIDWLGSFVEKAVRYGKTGDFFQHRRDGYKAIHVIRRYNRHGQFLEISEFHSGSHQGVLRVPEGKARQGWSEFSILCKNF